VFIFIRKNGYYASQKRLCKQPVLRGGIFIAFSKRQFEVEKSPKIQLYQYVREWLDTGKKFSGLIKKSACLLLPLNIERTTAYIPIRLTDLSSFAPDAFLYSSGYLIRKLWFGYIF
jgi:hypothetical protein